ncbi:MAG: selenium cofactor biosynthesis protein YqeC [Halobacteriales archaeon]|nr:selenium cofactor biosynthesis protein YqeC [Halobacteriales archaeon]
MDLAGALGLDDRALVAFVGAGGKKTAMARLVVEATERGLAAGYTTTTHVPPPELPLALSEPETLEAALEAHEPPVAFARSEVESPERAARKLRGFEPAVVDWLHRTRRFDWLLVKADGARRRPFKAPGPDEPALPEETTDLVAVAGVGVVGEPLTAEHVHRPERVAAVAGLDLGDPIDAEAVGRVLASADGGLKAVPPGAAVTFLLNQADTDALAETAHEVLEHALARADRPARGVVSSFEADRCEVVER